MSGIKDEAFKERAKQIPAEIEKLVAESGINYIEATVAICEKYEIELEGIKSVLPKAIKEKIEADASSLNMLTYKINTLI